jgi:hypothetical protein
MGGRNKNREESRRIGDCVIITDIEPFINYANTRSVHGSTHANALGPGVLLDVLTLDTIFRTKCGPNTKMEQIVTSPYQYAILKGERPATIAECDHYLESNDLRLPTLAFGVEILLTRQLIHVKVPTDAVIFVIGRNNRTVSSGSCLRIICDNAPERIKQMEQMKEVITAAAKDPSRKLLWGIPLS